MRWPRLTTFTKFPAPCETSKVHCRVKNSLTLGPLMSQMRSTYILVPSFLKFHFSIIL
jgi:hypothetical protein